MTMAGFTPVAYNGKFTLYVDSPTSLYYSQTTDPGGPSTYQANYSKIAAGGIADATISLLKWGGIATAVAGGAVIGASIIGLGEMAKFSSTASTGRKNALSLGTTYGNMNSFEVNFERLVNSRRILSMVNEARHDPNLLVGMLGARGDDTADMAADFV
ncbi:unnamed protein product [Sphagnum tenellum]